ncbi:hypothetical protein A6M21_12650 [Desulfotomaculum copahuensis]|uniref:Uncharacterized protein n=1 Tax=Desulfotomaculum copahuensis TaxID=1838280 RepID=A0A1B7LCX5_9FIRM|nr:hypothetical protein A6M21_12650 [Desulfotomaculum copahuensis]
MSGRVRPANSPGRVRPGPAGEFSGACAAGSGRQKSSGAIMTAGVFPALCSRPGGRRFVPGRRARTDRKLFLPGTGGKICRRPGSIVLPK